MRGRAPRGGPLRGRSPARRPPPPRKAAYTVARAPKVPPRDQLLAHEGSLRPLARRPRPFDPLYPSSPPFRPPVLPVLCVRARSGRKTPEFWQEIAGLRHSSGALPPCAYSRLVPTRHFARRAAAFVRMRRREMSQTRNLLPEKTRFRVRGPRRRPRWPVLSRLSAPAFACDGPRCVSRAPPRWPAPCLLLSPAVAPACVAFGGGGLRRRSRAAARLAFPAVAGGVGRRRN